MAQFAARVAELEAPGQNDREGGSGYDAKLAQAGDGPGERPAGDRDAHAALDDKRV